MKILVDTNVVLDVLLARAPHAAESTAVLAAIERRQVDGFLGATTVTTIHCLAARAVGARRARGHIETLLDLFHVAPVSTEILRRALALRFEDYEDAVLHEAAAAAGASAIVTRNVKDFGHALLPIYTPRELLAILAQ